MNNIHKVKCKYCQQIFDRDKEPFIKVSERRYAHLQCAEQNTKQKTQEQQDLNELEKYIKELFSISSITPKIRKQIKEYKEKYKYTYSGMKKTLIWWFEIKGNSVDKANGGIGIIPYIYQQAHDYYYALFLATYVNQDKDLSHYQPQIKAINIKSPQIKVRPRKLFKIEGD